MREAKARERVRAAGEEVKWGVHYQNLPEYQTQSHKRNNVSE